MRIESFDQGSVLVVYDEDVTVVVAENQPSHTLVEARTRHWGTVTGHLRPKRKSIYIEHGPSGLVYGCVVLWLWCVGLTVTGAWRWLPRCRIALACR